MTFFSPRLALNLNYLLSCRNAFCPAARATPCHTTPPLSCHATFLCWLVVTSPPLSLRHHLSCAGCLLKCHLSPRIAASLYHALRRSLDVVVAAPPSSPPPACHHRHRGDDRNSSRQILLLLPASSALLMSTSSTTTSSDPPMITVRCPIVQSNPRWQ